MSVERQAFEAELADLLKQLGLKFRKQPILGGLRPNFVVEHADGTTTVLEAKTWSPSDESIARAVEQASRYKELTKADRAIVVLRHLPPSQQATGVTSLAQLP